jgi:hypothetical protein
MKIIKIKPKLVDHSLFRSKPKALLPTLKPVEVLKAPELTNFSIYFNVIAFLILAIGGYLLYQRYCNKDSMRKEREHTIVGFNQYVRENT